MNLIRTLDTLIEHYLYYFWSASEIGLQKVTLGSQSEGNVVFEYSERYKIYQVHRTITEIDTLGSNFPATRTLAPWHYPPRSPEADKIQELIILIKSKMTNQDFSDRLTENYQSLVLTTNRFIYQNFNS